ncbi:MAG: cation diffusion facilitator family transporter [Prevotella sp.]|nr:cation diffusion facilitator family transporter [Prevotella sp.]
MKILNREKYIYRITLLGSLINLFLVAIKFLFGIIGNSSAMIADAVHSLSDLITDAVVIVFVHLSSKPQDDDHNYGHGKYETLATSLVGLALFIVGIMLLYGGVEKIITVLRGGSIAHPGIIALVAALISIVFKEIAYRFTLKAGKIVKSQTVIANAWHHRSDAFSSIGTALGIAGAIFLGNKWTVLDPIAAVVVSVFVIKTAWKLIRQAADELLEKSLSNDIKNEIMRIAESKYGVSEIHNLYTRRIGDRIAIEMHLRMPGDISLYIAHKRATEIEELLRHHFGKDTHIILHVEPLKQEGKYIDPDKE